jgi:oligosaccharyltransferase complex subunit alpha (ribophorin I)
MRKLTVNFRQTISYKVTLNKSVQPEQDVLLGINIVYTHSIRPLPKKLPQVARQHSIYGFNSYILSPYFTNEVKTTVM